MHKTGGRRRGSKPGEEERTDLYYQLEMDHFVERHA